MREIDLNQAPNVIPKNTFLVYGDSRSGKTTWAASFPRPLFFSDVTEGGWDSIANMPDEWLFEPGVKPLVWGIENMADMAIAREKAAPLIASGRVQTVVTDSLSYYSDLYLNFLLNMQAKKDTRAAYGDLGVHLRDLRVKTHMLPVNVVWLCLAQHLEEGGGGPMIPGQQAAKFMAGCHFIFHSRTYQEKRGQELLPATFELRTRKFNGYIAGNRLGGKANLLPDPLIGGYEDFIRSLGHDVDDIRRRLPKINGDAKAAKPVVVASKPPVAPKPLVSTKVTSAPNVVPTK
jgi:AAA domain